MLHRGPEVTVEGGSGWREGGGRREVRWTEGGGWRGNERVEPFRESRRVEANLQIPQSLCAASPDIYTRQIQYWAEHLYHPYIQLEACEVTSFDK